MWLPTATLPNLELPDKNAIKTNPNKDNSGKSLSPNKSSPSPSRSKQNIPKLDLSMNACLDTKSMSPTNTVNYVVYDKKQLGDTSPMNVST